jgi:hypothetical protein
MRQSGIKPGMVIRPHRGSGRLWRVGRRATTASDHFWIHPIGDDTGGFGGVKSLRRSVESLEHWEVVRA